MNTEERKEYHRQYYLLNKERMARQRLINYHRKKVKTTPCGRKSYIDLSKDLPPIKYVNTQTSFETPECSS